MDSRFCENDRKNDRQNNFIPCVFPWRSLASWRFKTGFWLWAFGFGEVKDDKKKSLNHEAKSKSTKKRQKFSFFMLPFFFPPSYYYPSTSCFLCSKLAVNVTGKSFFSGLPRLFQTCRLLPTFILLPQHSFGLRPSTALRPFVPL